jgi:hypothetical protein
LEAAAWKSIPTYSLLGWRHQGVEFSDQPEGKNSPFKLYTLAVDETDEVFIDVQHQVCKIVAGVLNFSYRCYRSIKSI